MSSSSASSNSGVDSCRVLLPLLDCWPLLPSDGCGARLLLLLLDLAVMSLNERPPIDGDGRRSIDNVPLPNIPKRADTHAAGEELDCC